MINLNEAQAIQIDNLLSDMDMRVTYMNKIFSISIGRVKKLTDAGFYTEELIIISQVAEHFIRLVLEGYVTKRWILKFLGQKDIYEEVSLKMEEEAPLGWLIGKLRAFDIDPSLARKLDKFNELRKEAIHHMCDGTKDFTVFDKEIKDYIAGKDFKDVFHGLGTVQLKVREDIKKLTGK